MKPNIDFFFRERIRLVVYGALAVALLLGLLTLGAVYQQVSGLRNQQLSEAAAERLFRSDLKELQGLIAKTAQYEQQNINVTAIKDQITIIKQTLFKDHQFTKVALLTQEADASLEEAKLQKSTTDNEANAAAQAAAALAAQEGSLNGTVRENTTGLSGVSISLYSGSTQITRTSSGSTGSYGLTATAATYSVVASKSGYVTLRQYNVTLTAQKTTTLDLVLTKAPPPPPTSSGSASTANSSYERRTITTSHGSFLVDVMTLNLGSGGIKVYTDTANDTDCTDNCPVKPLANYVSANGGFAGINGTYFCPSDYSSCAGKVNSFFWKVKNTRLGRMINQTNGLGENEAFLTFSSSGSPHYYSRWIDAPLSVFAGINSGPRLIENGTIVLTDGSMDDKQRTVKSNRGGLGIKGQTLYAIIARSATVPDATSVLQALGVDYGLNIDGGGSSAMYYNGSYKVGPGRSLPNAVIFVGS